VDEREAVQRWDAFLAKLKQRYDETLAQAEEGCAMLLDLNALDPLPMTNAWSGVENQLRELSEKVEQAFSEKVEPALEEAEAWEARDREREKGLALRRAFERAELRAEIRVFGDAARKVFARAKENLSRTFRCTQCRAPLPVSDRFFRSCHVPCPHCNTVNTFLPGTEVMSVESFCVHRLAQARTEALYLAWLDAEEAMNRSDDAPQAVAAAERALIAYTTAYLRARIEIVPEYEKDLEKDLAGRTAFFRERLAMAGRRP
jgi:hypothetical protein